jgi:lipopolysaccharide transport system permease protein
MDIMRPIGADARGEGGFMPEQTRAARESESSATAMVAPGVLPAPLAVEGREPVSTELPPLPETHIRPKTGWPSLDLADLWKCRDLIGQLTLRNVRVRYKQTVLGVLWAVIQPLLMMVVFVVALPRTGGALPNSIFLLSGLVPWFFFQTAVGTAANSVIGSEGLVTKVYFPRLAIPLSAVAAALLDLGVSFLVLVGLMVWYGILPGVSVALLPLAVLLLTLAAVGIGTLIAALTVSYRDFRHAVVFLLQVWMLATPAIYLNRETPSAQATLREGVATAASDQNTGKAPLADVRGSFSAGSTGGRGAWLARLNPMTVPIEFFRAAALGTPIAPVGVLISFVVNGALCLIGLYYFRHVEDSFADVI